MKFNVFEFASGEYLASLKQVNNQLRIVSTADVLAAQRFLSDSNLEKLGYLNGRLVTVEVKVGE